MAATLILAACGGADVAGNTAEAGNVAEPQQPQGTLADALGREENEQFTRALAAAGLQPTLSGPGPYTVLVPVDAAFAKLPAGALDGLLEPEAKPELTGLLTYHVLPGTILLADLNKAIDNGKGKAVLATMGSGILTATREGQQIILTDAAGGRAALTEGDQQHSNGVIHRIDSVLMPARASA